MQDLIANFWRRDRAQRISSKATDIWLGNEGDYEGLRVLLDELIDKQPEDSSNYVRVEDSVSDFLPVWARTNHKYYCRKDSVSDFWPVWARANHKYCCRKDRVSDF